MTKCTAHVVYSVMTVAIAIVFNGNFSCLETLLDFISVPEMSTAEFTDKTCTQYIYARNLRGEIVDNTITTNSVEHLPSWALKQQTITKQTQLTFQSTKLFSKHLCINI